MSARALIAKSALRKLLTKARDGTPFCPVCRRYGELNLMVSTGSMRFRQCAAWSLPVYAGTDRLTYEELVAGEACRGCGQDVLARCEPPSWLGKGTMFLSDEEQAGYDAAEAAFKARHPSCHALGWRMQGSRGDALWAMLSAAADELGAGAVDLAVPQRRC